MIDTKCPYCRIEMIKSEENPVPEVIKYLCPKCKVKHFYSIKSI